MLVLSAMHAVCTMRNSRERWLSTKMPPCPAPTSDQSIRKLIPPCKCHLRTFVSWSSLLTSFSCLKRPMTFSWPATAVASTLLSHLRDGFFLSLIGDTRKSSRIPLPFSVLHCLRHVACFEPTAMGVLATQCRGICGTCSIF